MKGWDWKPTDDEAAIEAIKLLDESKKSRLINMPWRYTAIRAICKQLGVQDHTTRLDVGDQIVAWRCTNRRAEFDEVKAGQKITSKNHASDSMEAGMSVSRGLEYAWLCGYKYAYQIRGVVAGFGSDGEPVIDTTAATTSVIGRCQTAATAVKRDKETNSKKLDKLAKKYSTTVKTLTTIMYL